MATKNTIDARALETLGARKLAELLSAATAHDAVAKRQLRLELAAANGPDAAAAEIRRRLAALSRAKKFVSRSHAATLADDLEVQREAIQKHVTEQDPGLALELLWRFITLGERVFDRCDDSYGLVGEVFRSARADIGRVAAAACPDPVKLADRTFEAIWRNGFGNYDGLIGELGPALGQAGLEHLRLRVLVLRDGRSAAARGAGRSNVVPGPWGRSPGRADEDDALVLFERAIPQALEDIADAQGDVDAFMEQYDERKRRIPVFAAEIARRLLEADRPEEALRILDDARLVRDGGWPAPDEEWRETRIDVLEALGRNAEAQVARWETFEKKLDEKCLRACLERLDEAGAATATEKALNHVAGYQDLHAALEFLLEWPDPARAAAVVIRRARELNGDYYDVLNAAASALAADHPLAATLALRAMIDFAMVNARSSRYRHASRRLLACAGLAEKIDDYRGFEDHDAYFAAIRKENARKSKFWAVLGDVMGIGGPFRP